MINVEGHKAFRGTMRITPKVKEVPPFELTGDWLYEPETGCWYGCGKSFIPDICEIVEDESKPVIHAHWEPANDNKNWYHCSACGYEPSDDYGYDGYDEDEYGNVNTADDFNYCPHCGAKMCQPVKPEFTKEEQQAILEEIVKDFSE